MNNNLPARISYWEQSAMLTADFVVIGAGIIGLSTAIELATMHPTARIVVLERGVLPAGASSRNAGFACFGSLTEIMDDITLMGLERTVQQIRDRWDGLHMLRARAGDAAMAYESTGNYDVIAAETLLPALDRLSDINALLRPLLHGSPDDRGDVFTRVDDRIAAFGFCTNTVRALVHNQYEGQLDSGRLMDRLCDLAVAHGVWVRYGSPVVGIHDAGDRVAVIVQEHATQTHITWMAHAVGVCTNGFTRDLIPDACIVPARGQVLVTEPIPDLRFRGAFHMDRGFVYFRDLAGSRILLGGARNHDIAGETTTDLNVTQPIMQHLEHLLYDVILNRQPSLSKLSSPSSRHPRIATRWAGIMGFSPDKTPRVDVSLISPRCIVGFGCNGMGVAMGSAVAQRTAAKMSCV